MLTIDQARAIAATWRERFADQAGFEQSWARFFDMVGDPTTAKLEQWLAKDQSKDAVKHAGIVRDPLLPQRQHFDIGDESDCHVCHGKRYVRRDVPISHPDFGGALRCPACTTRKEADERPTDPSDQVRSATRSNQVADPHRSLTPRGKAEQ